MSALHKCRLCGVGIDRKRTSVNLRACLNDFGGGDYLHAIRVGADLGLLVILARIAVAALDDVCCFCVAGMDDARAETGRGKDNESEG